MSTLDIILIVIGLGAFSLLVAGAVVLPLIRGTHSSDDSSDENESDGGWGNEPNVQPKPSHWPGGGIPLPDAVHSSVRLRSDDAIWSGRGLRERRPAHPVQPVRRPVHY